MPISVIQQSWFRDTSPCFAELKFATLIFFGSVCNYILAVLFIYYNVYFEAASTCKCECQRVMPDPTFLNKELIFYFLIKKYGIWPDLLQYFYKHPLPSSSPTDYQGKLWDMKARHTVSSIFPSLT